MQNTVKKLCIMLAFCGTGLTYLIYFTNVFNDFKQFVVVENLPNSKIKYVLYWTPFWNKKDFYIGYGFKPFEDCEYKNCFATNNRTFIPVQEFDAIIFHATIYNIKQHGIPRLRLPHQIYIYMNMEAPINSSPNLNMFASYYNWTMSYRFDSDIVARHGKIVKGETNYTIPSKLALTNKTKVAAWFVSHCNTRSLRELLVKKLQKYIPVDIYGMCGKLRCPRKKVSNLPPIDCYDMVEKEYKFYFSFENSYCRDYATEKLYNVLRKNVVPVVYGDGTYSLSAPPNSLINVANFQSASELADYLKFLHHNVDEYIKYFEWKKKYRITATKPSTACQICKKLHEPLKQSIYNDLHGWWWGENNSMCKTGKYLPKIIAY